MDFAVFDINSGVRRWTGNCCSSVIEFTSAGRWEMPSGDDDKRCEVAFLWGHRPLRRWSRQRAKGDNYRSAQLGASRREARRRGAKKRRGELKIAYINMQGDRKQEKLMEIRKQIEEEDIAHQDAPTRLGRTFGNRKLYMGRLQ